MSISSASVPRKKRIGLVGLTVLASQQNPFHEALLRYAVNIGHWEFVISVEATVAAFRSLRAHKCDGAIVRIVSPAMAREARRSGIPMVNFSSWLADTGVPTVRFDNAALGRLCATHLLEKGFRRFGIVRITPEWLIQQRMEGFLAAVAAAGFSAGVSFFDTLDMARKGASKRPGRIHSTTLQPTDDPIEGSILARFTQWVATLRPPVGLFLTGAGDAPRLMDACRRAGFRIPQDIAVITANGHHEFIHDCHPPLSHGDEDEPMMGFRVAECLDRLLSGKPLENFTSQVPPLGVKALGSTDTVAIDDCVVARAREHMRANACEPINIKDVTQRFSIARRTLERHFRATMGISLHEFLTRERVERAKDLLRSTPALTLKEVARRCGFAGAKRLKLVFRRVTGISHVAWRHSASSR
jgi:LacI family transcriptional regulator